jgi:hypothetical protein
VGRTQFHAASLPRGSGQSLTMFVDYLESL